MNKKERLLRDHNKWLESMGVTVGRPKKVRINPNKLPDLRAGLKTLPPTSDTVGNGFAKANNTYTGSGTIVVGQAYNKGNFVVLTKEDAADPATGKRRC